MAMASCSLRYFFLLSLSLFFVCCFSAISHKPLSQHITLPIFKDPQTNLFYSLVTIGQNPLYNMHLTIDLGGAMLWYLTDSHYSSSSSRPIPCDSPQCPSFTYCSGGSNETCGVYIVNPLANDNFVLVGDLVGNDVMSIYRTKVSSFVSCRAKSDEHLLDGLPKQSKGIIGLARTNLSLHSQLSLLNNLPPKFSICFPSSTNNKISGRIFFGSRAPLSMSRFLVTTPLIINPHSIAPRADVGDPSYEYFIKVLSINVDDKVVNFDPSLLSFDKNGNGGTKISTMQNFTRLHSNIFKPLVMDFVKKASDRKMKKVESVAPFEACFDEQSIKKTSSGILDVPLVELRVEGDVGWVIHGSNSMVKVKKNVVCLGFVDGGKPPKCQSCNSAIVIGGHQLEDNLLEFDLTSSKMRYSSSLLIQNATCSPKPSGSFSSLW